MTLVLRSNEVDSDVEDRIRRVKLLAFDFDGVFTDNAVYISDDGREMVRCERSEGIGLRKVEAAGVGTIVISTETNPVVTLRSAKLAVRCIQSCTDKRAALDELLSELSLSLDQVAFVGNDVNDLPCLSVVGLPIVVQDAHEDVLPFAKYITRRPGGHGAVREVCDLFARVLAS